MNHRKGERGNGKLCVVSTVRPPSPVSHFKPLNGFPATLSRRKEEEARNSHRIRQKVICSTLTEGCGLVKNTFQATDTPHVSWTDNLLLVTSSENHH